MKHFQLCAFLCGAIGAILATAQNGTCIADNEVEGIAQRWLNAFATGGLSGLPEAVTSDVRNIGSLLQQNTLPHLQ